jgi:hypothetical protein
MCAATARCVTACCGNAPRDRHAKRRPSMPCAGPWRSPTAPGDSHDPVEDARRRRERAARNLLGRRGLGLATQLLQVGHILAKGENPRYARELRSLREDAPDDVAPMTEFWFDSSNPVH